MKMSKKTSKRFRVGQSKFPRIIHFIWFQGAQNLPDKYLNNISSFSVMNPHWEQILWDDASLRKECSAIGSRCLQTYMSFEHMHQKIDFGRYVVLYRYGGTSVDIDMQCLRPFDILASVTKKPISHHDVIISFSPANEKESRIAMFGTGLNFMYNNAWIMSKQYAPPMLRLIDGIIKIAQNTYRCGGLFKDKYLCIMTTTGPVAFTSILAKIPKVLVLDKKYFESCVGWQKNCKPHEAAFVFHEHDNTWIPSIRKRLFETYFKYIRGRDK